MSSPPPPPPRRSKPDLAPVRERIELSTVSKRASAVPPEPAPAYSAHDFEHAVHLDGQGNILAGSGRIEELASLAAYACRIGSLVGRQLSFGDVVGMEVTLANGVILLHRDNHGEIVSVKPQPHVNLVQLRAQLNL